MGAFDGELYRLGYRFYTPDEPEPQRVNTVAMIRAEYFDKQHKVHMQCPGSCGAACSNHYCSAHNGSTYEKQPDPHNPWKTRAKK
jgi:hypothetical protein